MCIQKGKKKTKLTFTLTPSPLAVNNIMGKMGIFIFITVKVSFTVRGSRVYNV